MIKQRSINGIMALSIALIMGLQTSQSFATDESIVASTNTKIVIAHRGASGYFPEHSMASKKLAFSMGADFIEQDLVLSKDDKLLVLHDIYLDRVTNVSTFFPNRARNDGRFYAIDFTYNEIKTLSLTERFKIKNNRQVAVFPNRTPLWQGEHYIHLFEDELALIKQLNSENNRVVGIYPEIKAPSFHRNEGKDISRIVLNALNDFGYNTKNSNVYLQSFDANELQRIHQRLLPELQIDLKLVQLIAMTSWGITKIYNQESISNYNYDWMLAAGAMDKIAKYADGIGPFKEMLVTRQSTKGNLDITPMLRRAHQAGLVVHPYTFRLDKGRVAKYADNFADMLNIFYYKVGVDGVFTDFPDKAVEFLKKSKK